MHETSRGPGSGSNSASGSQQAHGTLVLARGTASAEPLQTLRFARPPPTAEALLASMQDMGMLLTVHTAAHFTKRSDIPVASRTLAGDVCRWTLPGVAGLPQWLSPLGALGGRHRQAAASSVSAASAADASVAEGAGPRATWTAHQLASTRRTRWRQHGLVVVTPARVPPMRSEADAWLATHPPPPLPRPPRLAVGGESGRGAEGSTAAAAAPTRGALPPKPAKSQLEAPTPANTFGFRLQTQHVSNSTALQAEQHLKLLSMELFADSRGSKQPHPDFDPVRALVYVFHGDTFPSPQRIKPRVLAVRVASGRG